MFDFKHSFVLKITPEVSQRTYYLKSEIVFS